MDDYKAFQDELSVLRQYRNMVDETNIVSKADLRGNITYVNNKFIKISGYTREELIGKPHNIVRDPQTPSSIFKEMWRTIKSKNIWHGVVSNIRKDGTKYTVNASIFPILDSEGEIVEYISIRHDITQLLELSKELEEIHKYTTKQEHLAKEKLESGIINDLNEDECIALHISSDILSGDFYSVYKMQDGSVFLYIIDGQGHGISPALTVFAVSSMLNQFVYNMNSMQELIERLHPAAKTFLAELEQLSYTMLMISPDKKNITYSSGGMYPILIKKGDETIKLKANNPPFMNFSPVPVFDTVNLGEWDRLMIYSDGIIEHKCEDLEGCKPESIIQSPSKIKEAFSKISGQIFEDDVTIVYIENSK